MGECVAYYPNLDTKMAAWQLVAEPNAHMLGCQALNKFELSTNCTHAKNCDYNLGTESNVGCMACDDGCRTLAIDEARANMEPLSNGSLFIFFVLVIVGVYNDYLMERASVAILLLGLMLMGASILITVGLFLQSKLTGLLVFIGNVALAGFSILLLCVSITAGLSAGTVTNINEEIDAEWDTIRLEIHTTDPNYCAYMDDDQCKKKIRDAVEANFYHVGLVCVFVLIFLVGKMFLVHKTMKFFFKFDKDEHAEMHP